MKKEDDNHTIDMLEPIKRGRGRPNSGKALTDAERAAAYRARKKAAGLVKRYVPAKD